MKRRDEVLVGLLLTVALLIGIGGTIWLVRGGFRRGYSLYSTFRWGENLKVGQPVRLAGVQVGYVGDVQLRDNGTLVVDMKIDNGRKVPRNARAVVEAVGIFGDAQIGLQAQPDPRSYAPGDTVPVGVTAAGIAQLTAKGDTVASQAVVLSNALRAELVDSGGLRDVRRTLAETNALVARLGTLAAQFGTIAAQQNRELSRTQASFRRALSGIDSAKVDSTLTGVRAASNNAAALTDSLKSTASRLNAALAGIERGEGSAGKLLRDTLLYSDVRRLVGRIDTLTLDFQRNPGKYTRGVVRIF
jgi:phospholipid/cholesterol/gamma-HCH transport system substrate-binding protein